MSEWLLEQRIYIKFCIQLGKYTNGNWAMLSEIWGGEASSVFEWRKRFKKGHKKVHDEVFVQVLTEPMKMLKKWGI
jgi:hypothetical protein